MFAQQSGGVSIDAPRLISPSRLREGQPLRAEEGPSPILRDRLSQGRVMSLVGWLLATTFKNWWLQATTLLRLGRCSHRLHVLCDQSRRGWAMPEHEFEIYLSVLSRLMKLDKQQKSAIADELSDHLEERFEGLVRSPSLRQRLIKTKLRSHLMQIYQISRPRFSGIKSASALQTSLSLKCLNFFRPNKSTPCCSMLLP